MSSATSLNSPFWIISVHSGAKLLFSFSHTLLSLLRNYIPMAFKKRPLPPFAAATAVFLEHRTIPALGKHRSGSCGTASALPKCSIRPSSIICAFGLASAAPRSPYRHLELCGIALERGITERLPRWSARRCRCL